jgi:hypothetical protein
MKTADRQKMCSSCDGKIPMDATECVYCAAEQPAQPAKQQGPLFTNQTLQESLASLYTPPYSAKNPAFSQPEKKVETYKEVKKSPQMSLPLDPPEEEPVEKNNALLPLFLLLIGGNLLTVGLLQLILSNQGFLRLEWECSYWFLYCLAALPLFYFGFKKVNQLK